MKWIFLLFFYLKNLHIAQSSDREDFFLTCIWFLNQNILMCKHFWKKKNFNSINYYSKYIYLTKYNKKSIKKWIKKKNYHINKFQILFRLMWTLAINIYINKCNFFLTLCIYIQRLEGIHIIYIYIYIS